MDEGVARQRDIQRANFVAPAALDSTAGSATDVTCCPTAAGSLEPALSWASLAGAGTCLLRSCSREIHLSMRCLPLLGALSPLGSAVPASPLCPAR